MATFSVQEQLVTVRFVNLRGAPPTEIDCQSSETYVDGVTDVSSLDAWLRHLRQGRASRDVTTRLYRPGYSLSDDSIRRVEKILSEDH